MDSQTRQYLIQQISHIKRAREAYEESMRMLSSSSSPMTANEAVWNWHKHYLEFSRVVRECAFSSRSETGGLMVSDAADVCLALEASLSNEGKYSSSPVNLNQTC